MLTSIHFLLTYTCTFECDHCFLYCSPRTEGTFTVRQLRDVFDEIAKMPAVKSVCFEGGEPFLYHPLLLEGLRLARDHELEASIVTNSYWANSFDDALLWLKPIKEIGLKELCLSDDAFHHNESRNPARIAAEAARALGIPDSSITIDPPTCKPNTTKGDPVVKGGVLFRGRAIEKLSKGMPTKAWPSFDSCPHEELQQPNRVHVDSFGNVHICQGISIGNMWQTPLSQIDREYDWEFHPVCGPLVEGGPAKLARDNAVEPETGYIDACHLCWLTRRELLDRLPDSLGPRQIYGLPENPPTHVSPVI